MVQWAARSEAPPQAVEDRSSAREPEELGRDWVILRDCRLGPPSRGGILPTVLMHPARGVAVLDILPSATPGAVEALRAKLHAARFPAIFAGHLPVVHLQVTPRQMPFLPSLLNDAFAAEPPLQLPGGDAWVGVAVRALTAEQPVPRLESRRFRPSADGRGHRRRGALLRKAGAVLLCLAALGGVLGTVLNTTPAPEPTSVPDAAPVAAVPRSTEVAAPQASTPPAPPVSVPIPAAPVERPASLPVLASPPAPPPPVFIPAPAAPPAPPVSIPVPAAPRPSPAWSEPVAVTPVPEKAPPLASPAPLPAESPPPSPTPPQRAVPPRRPEAATPPPPPQVRRAPERAAPRRQQEAGAGSSAAASEVAPDRCGRVSALVGSGAPLGDADMRFFNENCIRW